MEKEKIVQPDVRSSQKNQELADFLKKVDEIKDLTGRGIDAGIKEGVAVFNAIGLGTSQSCAGHFGEAPEKSSRQTSTPWIEVAANEPVYENWYGNAELRERVIKEKNELMLRAINLLDGFYKGRPTPYDVRLGFDRVGYRFRIQSVGAEVFEELTRGFSSGEKTQKAAEYKREMNDFVDFLRNKYLDK